MTHLSLLLNQLKDRIIYSEIRRDEIPDAEGILLLDPAEPLLKDYIYLTTEQTAKKILNTRDVSGLTLIVASKSWDSSVKIPPDCNLAVADMERASVYNKLFFEIKRRRTLKDELGRISSSDQRNIQRLLETALKYMELEGALHVLSPTFQLLYCASNMSSTKDVLTDAMPVGDYLSDTQITKCMENMSTSRNGSGAGIDSKNIYRTYPIKGNGLLGYLLVFGEPAEPVNFDLLNMLLNALPDFLIPLDEHEIKDYQLLARIMDDVLISPNMDIDRMQKRLKQTPDPVDMFIRSVLIEFDADKVSVKHFVSELKKLFSTNNVTMYDGRIVAWLSGPNHVFVPDFDEEKFDALLKRFDAKAIISNPGRFVRGIRTLYIQCKEVLPILSDLDFVLKGRSWAYFDEVSFYHLIQLCSSSLKQHYGHEKLVYIAGPTIMEVLRYDQDNGTNFLEFLFAYVENGRNIGKTAADLHMHRNTVVYKLKKVEELLHTDALDTRIFHDLEISCRIMMYAKHVAKETYNLILDKVQEEEK